MCMLEVHSTYTYFIITRFSSCTAYNAHKRTKVGMREAPNGQVREEEKRQRWNKE